LVKQQVRYHDNAPFHDGERRLFYRIDSRWNYPLPGGIRPVNGATPRTTIALEAVRALAQHGTVAPVTLHQRIDFAASMVDGRTVGELNPRSRSADEVTALWQYVLTQLRQDVKRT